jgi:hypothetical protein
MASDAVVTLEELSFLEVSGPTETRVEPYIWPVLIWVDDTTIANPAQPILVNTISQGSARRVIRDSMRVGDTAPIPAQVSTLRMRFDENAKSKHLILVVALLENDETPLDAVRAGFRAFVSELTAAVSSRLGPLATTTGDERDAIIDEINEQVSDAVESAVRDHLSFWEKVRVTAGVLDLDDAVGAGFVALADKEIIRRAISIVIEGTGSFLDFPTRSRFGIFGRLRVQPVVVDRCQDQVNAVNTAQAVVAGIEQQIENLQAQLSGGGDGEEPPLPPHDRDFLKKEIERIREEELVPAIAALEAARAALRRCRADTGPVLDPRAGGVAPPTR